MTSMRLVLFGDGESPHLLKWARALAPQLELWAASSRGFLPGFDALLPAERAAGAGHHARAAGGNVALLRKLPLLAQLAAPCAARLDHAHYLSSHGTLAWLATTMLGAPGPAGGFGLGFGHPGHAAAQRAACAGLTRRVLRACALTTSDSSTWPAHARAGGGRGDVLSLRPGGAAAAAGAKDDLRCSSPTAAWSRSTRRNACSTALPPSPRPARSPGWWWPTTARCAARCIRRKCEAGSAGPVRFVGR
jgi:L-malate glycosyltransferase